MHVKKLSKDSRYFFLAEKKLKTPTKSRKKSCRKMVPEWDPYFRKIESTNNMKQIKVPSHFGAFRCWFAEVDLADEVHGHPWSGRGRLDDCHPWNHTRNTDTWTRGCSHHFLECVPLWGIWYRQGFSFTLERKLINDLTEIFIELSQGRIFCHLSW